MKTKLKSKHFKYDDLLIEFVNKENIKVISICGAGKFSEGYILFYEEIIEY